jgi:hypothetical protein
MTNGAEVIRSARQMNPDIRVLARAPYLRDVPALRAAGATSVHSGEGEVPRPSRSIVNEHGRTKSWSADDNWSPRRFNANGSFR